MTAPNRLNLATNTGQNPSLKMPGQERDPIASPFVHGSFSGADIKVVVSYPITEATARSEIGKLTAQQDEILREYNAIVDDIGRRTNNSYILDNRSGLGPSLYNRMESLKERHSSLQARIDLLEEQSNKINSISSTKTLAELQTISWSIFREKSPVRTLGAVYPRAFVRGPRTIAGTMIFTLFDKSALYDILTLGLNPYNTGTSSDRDYYHDSTALIDQLPPLDMAIIGNNEYGQTSYMNLWGVEFMNDGGTFSIEDLFTETVVQYSARDIDLLRPSIGRETDALTNLLTGKTAPISADQLYKESFMSDARARKRRNPYI